MKKSRVESHPPYAATPKACSADVLALHVGVSDFVVRLGNSRIPHASSGSSSSKKLMLLGLGGRKHRSKEQHFPARSSCGGRYSSPMSPLRKMNLLDLRQYCSTATEIVFLDRAYSLSDETTETRSGRRCRRYNITIVLDPYHPNRPEYH